MPLLYLCCTRCVYYISFLCLLQHNLYYVVVSFSIHFATLSINLSVVSQTLNQNYGKYKTLDRFPPSKVLVSYYLAFQHFFPYFFYFLFSQSGQVHYIFYAISFYYGFFSCYLQTFLYAFLLAFLS